MSLNKALLSNNVKTCMKLHENKSSVFYRGSALSLLFVFSTAFISLNDDLSDSCTSTKVSIIHMTNNLERSNYTFPTVQVSSNGIWYLGCLNDK